jgi:peptidoglycan hydrolase-like protein with peptidoglycan-binding domain
MLPGYLRLFVTLLGGLALLKAQAHGLPPLQVAPAGAPPLQTQPLTSDFIKSLQRGLKRAGYDPGTADGKMGPATQRALKRFQEAHGLLPTGDPDIPTLTKLLGQGLLH